MTRAFPSMRSLPPYILKTKPIEYQYWEGQSVQDKYSNPEAKIGETNTDYVALHYMSAHAALYWLPHYLSYLMNDAPRDTYLFDVVMGCLSSAEFVDCLRPLAARSDAENVLGYLAWLEQNVADAKIPDDRLLEFNAAKQLWSDFT